MMTLRAYKPPIFHLDRTSYETKRKKIATEVKDITRIEILNGYQIRFVEKDMAIKYGS